MRMLAVTTRYRLHHSRLLQILMLCGIWFAGDSVARVLHLPVPGAIVGLFFALGLLGSGVISLHSMRRGADCMLAEMLLFFVPAVIAMIDHREFLGWVGLKLVAVILLGTLIVMSVTALTVDLCCRLAASRDAARIA